VNIARQNGDAALQLHRHVTQQRQEVDLFNHMMLAGPVVI
jgi:hypothetical protein